MAKYYYLGFWATVGYVKNLISNLVISSITGLQAALDGKLDDSQLKTTLSDNSDSYIASQKAVKTAVDGRKSIDSSYTLTNSLALDSNSGSIAIATLNDGSNKAMSIANLSALGTHNAFIVNTHSSTITITLPTAANHVYGASQFTLAQNLHVEVIVKLIGTKTWWSISPLKTVTT